MILNFEKKSLPRNEMSKKSVIVCLGVVLFISTALSIVFGVLYETNQRRYINALVTKVDDCNVDCQSDPRNGVVICQMTLEVNLSWMITNKTYTQQDVPFIEGRQCNIKCCDGWVNRTVSAILLSDSKASGFVSSQHGGKNPIFMSLAIVFGVLAYFLCVGTALITTNN